MPDKYQRKREYVQFKLASDICAILRCTRKWYSRRRKLDWYLIALRVKRRDDNENVKKQKQKQ